MDRIVLNNYLDDPQSVMDEIQSLPPAAWNEYKNPFERKLALNKTKYDDDSFKAQVDSGAFYIRDGPLMQPMINMAHADTCWWISRLLDVPIECGDINHYGGVFIYNSSDYLKPHCDAGKHPVTKQHKVATACLYLTPAILYFYKGDPVWFDSPLIHHIDQIVHAPANSLVLFQNHDTAWHEVPTTSQQRIVITVSYLAPPNYEDPRFMNRRTRAYFARHMSVPDSPELAELRIKRASEEYHQEVYRV